MNKERFLAIYLIKISHMCKNLCKKAVLGLYFSRDLWYNTLVKYSGGVPVIGELEW